MHVVELRCIGVTWCDSKGGESTLRGDAFRQSRRRSLRQRTTLLAPKPMVNATFGWSCDSTHEDLSLCRVWMFAHSICQWVELWRRVSVCLGGGGGARWWWWWSRIVCARGGSLVDVTGWPKSAFTIAQEVRNQNASGENFLCGVSSIL